MKEHSAYKVSIIQIPKPKLFRFGFGSVILTETETTDLPIFKHFVVEMDFRKKEKI